MTGSRNGVIPVKKAFTHHLSRQEKRVMIQPKYVYISNSRHVDDYSTSHSFHVVVLQDVQNLSSCADRWICIGCRALIVNDDDYSLHPWGHKVYRALTSIRQKLNETENPLRNAAYRWNIRWRICLGDTGWFSLPGLMYSIGLPSMSKPFRMLPWLSHF